MMDVIKRPLLHEHYLLFDKYNKQEASCCDKCNQQIDDHDWALNCETCNFWLHKSCALQQLPPKISHPLHPHQLTLFCGDSSLLICHKCLNLTRGCIYVCTTRACFFMLDLMCASSTIDIEQTPKEESQTRSIMHFSHSLHPLYPFNYRKIGKDDYICTWCQNLLSSGLSYGCLARRCYGRDLFFHESCLIDMPASISKHQFHPLHPLYLQPVQSHGIECSACTDTIFFQTINNAIYVYTCKKCKFYLDINCVTFQPSIKHELHEHSLTYFRIKPIQAFLRCNICNENIGHGSEAAFDEIVFYRCVQCDFNLHFSCIQIPSHMKHEYHRHELKLVDYFIEDDSDEYFCDICEKERKPKHHVYCCKTCKYVAHIRCVLNKSTNTEEDHSSTSNLVGSKAMEQDETKLRNAKFTTHLDQIDHFDHEHPLSFIEVIDQNKNLLCKACCLKIFCQAYACKSCNYYMHKECIQLPYEVLHNLHPQHSLKLFTVPPPFPCLECKNYYEGFAYLCFPCGFLLHVKCTYSSSMPKYDEILSQRRKEIESRPSMMCLFNQGHKLDFVDYGSNLNYYVECSFCQASLRGPSYECLSCQYKLHEWCLGFPMEKQFQFHPQHPLRAVLVFGEICFVCQYPISKTIIGYSCVQCEIYLHYDCARILKRVVKSTSHMHNVHYVQREMLVSYYFSLLKNCGKCQGKISGGTAFYVCRECDTLLHFECAQIPESIKSKYHIHPLNLASDLIEDESEEYYCDICEEERYSKDHVYHCIECQGSFVAHIDCILTSVEEEPFYQAESKVSSAYESTEKQLSNEEN